MNVGWSFIRRRRRLSIAMKIGEGINLTRNLIFWAIRFAQGSRRTGGASSSLTSVRRFQTVPRRPSVMRFEVGGCSHAATSRLRICLGCSTRSFGAGSNIMGGITALRCICRCVNWTKRWRVGRRRNTRGFTVVNGAHTQWIARMSRRAPLLFAHWRMMRQGSIVGAV